MNGNFGGNAVGCIPLLPRPARRQAANRKHALGQGKQFFHLVEMQPHLGDVAAAQPRRLGGDGEVLHHQGRIDRGVEKAVQCVLCIFVAAGTGDRPVAARITAKQKHHRRRRDPGGIGQLGQTAFFAGIRHMNDRELHEIRLRRRRQGARQQQLQQRAVHGFIGIFPVCPVRKDGFEHLFPRRRR